LSVHKNSHDKNLLILLSRLISLVILLAHNIQKECRINSGYKNYLGRCRYDRFEAIENGDIAALLKSGRSIVFYGVIQKINIYGIQKSLKNGEFSKMTKNIHFNFSFLIKIECCFSS